MQYTLLELVQTIASSMDSDEINSITDSVESQQIAKIVRTVFYDIVERANLPENFSLKNLTASTDTSKPVIMYIPDDVAEIKWLKYDNRTLTDTDVQMNLVQYLPLEDFMNRMDSMDQDGTGVGSFTQTSGTDQYTIVYYNDRFPQYYTSWDDYTLLFDAYNSSVDSTLQSHKTRAYCKLNIPFVMSDTFKLPIDEAQQSLLLHEAKSLAWTELKQSAHPKAEKSANRAWGYLNKTKFDAQHTSDFDELPYYGRK